MEVFSFFKKHASIKAAIVLFVLVIILYYIAGLSWIRRVDHTLNTIDTQRFNVAALVFAGRRQYVEVLNCYLEKNLKENGGLLSEVIFILKTDKHDDIIYLHQLVAQHPRSYFLRNDTNSKWTYSFHYRNLNPHWYYVKIDDDIVYIHPNTIESLLKVKLNNAEAIFVSANVINHPQFGKLHLHSRALLNLTDTLPKDAETDLPVCEWEKVQCARIHHYSFLRHHEEKTLDVYMFPLWDLNALEYRRWSINFFLFKGHEVQDVQAGDDEHQISIVIPKKHKKHSLVVGSALVAHYSYKSQRLNGFTDETFLSDYRKLAEKICAKKHL